MTYRSTAEVVHHCFCLTFPGFVNLTDLYGVLLKVLCLKAVPYSPV
jgi:hypothetical protein